MEISENTTDRRHRESKNVKILIEYGMQVDRRGIFVCWYESIVNSSTLIFSQLSWNTKHDWLVSNLLTLLQHYHVHITFWQFVGLTSYYTYQNDLTANREVVWKKKKNPNAAFIFDKEGNEKEKQLNYNTLNKKNYYTHPSLLTNNVILLSFCDMTLKINMRLKHNNNKRLYKI